MTYDVFGQQLTAAEIARHPKCVVTESTLRHRLAVGQPAHAAATTPANPKKNNRTRHADTQEDGECQLGRAGSPQDDAVDHWPLTGLLRNLSRTQAFAVIDACRHGSRGSGTRGRHSGDGGGPPDEHCLDVAGRREGSGLEPARAPGRVRVRRTCR
ncbi:hypothetical protein HX747_30540 [Streptomyces sp. L06]|nr:hypothetical protein [Streptomyces sp. L06]